MSRQSSPQRQQGVVLIIALIMLVVVSMLATLSIRSATSTEAISGNARTTALAGQAAEAALRYCEDTLYSVHKGNAAPAGWHELAYVLNSTPQATTATFWDGSGTLASVFVAPMSIVNSGTATFHRAPECVVENLMVIKPGAPPTQNTSTTYVITARGFGPEVAATDASRARPLGSEVWLQSTVELN